MDLKVLDGKGKELGVLTSTLNAFVTEERNGMFELELEHLVNKAGYEHLVRGNIIVCNTSDTIKNQQFRIYRASKAMAGRVVVNARHISFDLAKDVTEGLDIKNQSCEYVLNQLFRNSQFSTDYKGYSDVINAQDYKIGEENILRAIGGVKGSILDTFGTGAELLRDNKTISVLNRRGRDNGVTIEYAKNLTGFNLTLDDSNLITRIKAFAKYTPEGGEETKIYSNPKYVDSPLVGNYETPYITTLDFSDKFKDNEIPTSEKLKSLAEKYFRDTKCDIVKQNYKIDFIPLSKCVGYESLDDKISLCDEVTIINKMYNITTQAKVIKSKFNVLLDRLERLELGEAKTTLGDVIGGSGGQAGPPGKDGVDGKPGADGNMGDFPNSLPNTPILHSKVYGFSNVELSWTFENEVYYSYELYASREKNFTPNTFNLLFEGQASTFLNQLEPNETWYYKICAVNSHGERTQFSNEVEVNTVKIEDLSNYVGSAAIGDALIGELNLGRGWFGELRGNYIDAKQLSVTDGNGKRTLDIDSFGNVNLDVSSFKIRNESVFTQNEVNSKLAEIETTTDSISSKVSQVESTTNTINGKVNSHESRIASAEQKITPSAIINTVSKTIDDKVAVVSNDVTELKQSSEDFQFSVETTSRQNLLVNSEGVGVDNWAGFKYNTDKRHSFVTLNQNDNFSFKDPITNTFELSIAGGGDIAVGSEFGVVQVIPTQIGQKYNFSTLVRGHRCAMYMKVRSADMTVLASKSFLPSSDFFELHDISFVAKETNTRIEIGMENGFSSPYLWFAKPMANLGAISKYMCGNRGLYQGITKIDANGVRCDFEDGTYASIGRSGLRYYKNGMNKPYQYITFNTKIAQIRNGYWAHVQLPDFFKGKQINQDFQLLVTLGAYDLNKHVIGSTMGALRVAFAEWRDWNSSEAVIQVRPCFQKIGISTGTLFGWDAASTSPNGTANEGVGDVIIYAQM